MICGTSKCYVSITYYVMKRLGMDKDGKKQMMDSFRLLKVRRTLEIIWFMLLI